MAVIPLVPETNVGKLISLGNLLVRKVMWLMLTTRSANLILSRVFGADCTTRIAYIYLRLTETHSLSHFHLQRQHTLTLFHDDLQRQLAQTLSLLHFDFQRQLSLSLSLSLYIYLVTQLNTRNMGAYTFCNLFLSLLFRLDFFQPRTLSQKFCQTLKENNN